MWHLPAGFATRLDLDLRRNREPTNISGCFAFVWQWTRVVRLIRGHALKNSQETIMRRGFTRFGVIAALFVAPLLLTGCAASSEQITSIQNTANRAMSTAEHALSVAQSADQKADRALSLAEQANEKVDRMFQRNLRK
jgi:Alanine-zipper, major outer membrane lipoprotein